MGSLVSRIADLQDKRLYAELNWTGTFDDYLELVRQTPEVTRTAWQRLYDMIVSHGVSEYTDTKKKVTHDLETLGYNTAIAAMMELLNAMRDSNCSERQIVKDLVIMVAPFAPHFAEECWERLGYPTTVFDAKWPTWDEALTIDNVVEIVVQVNGKTRSTVRSPRGAIQDAVLPRALADDTVKRFIEGREVRKVIFVKDRLINLVVG